MDMVWSRHRRLAVTAVASLAGLVLVAGACGKSSDSQAGSEMAQPASPKPATGAADDLSTGEAGSEPAANGAPSLMVDALKAPAVQPGSFISTASLTIAVEDVSAVKPRVLAVADEVGGALFNEESSYGSRSKSTITLKVPPAAFNATLARLAPLGEVVTQQVKTDDVTQQVIDLDARINAASTSLDRVRALLGEARSINDIITLEREVTRRQGELESLRGQQKTLQARIALATVVVTLDGGPVERPSDELPGFLDGLRGGWEVAKDLAVLASAALGALLPFLPLIVLVVLLFRWLSRRARRIAAGGSGRSGPPGGYGGPPGHPAPPPPPAPDPASHEDQPTSVG